MRTCASVRAGVRIVLPVRVAMVVKNIAVLAGDGIGPEVMAEAQKVLVKIQEFSGHELAFTGATVGGAAWEGDSPPAETLDICQQSDGILFGFVGRLVSEQNLPKLREERVARAAQALQPGCESSPFSRTSVR